MHSIIHIYNIYLEEEEGGGGHNWELGNYLSHNWTANYRSENLSTAIIYILEIVVCNNNNSYECK